MQAPAQLALKLFQGAFWDYTLTWKVNDELVDLGGFTARLQARPTPSSATLVLDLTDSDGIVLDGSAGTITLMHSAEQTAALTPGKYVYELALIAGTSVVSRLVQGQLEVDAEATRGRRDRLHLLRHLANIHRGHYLSNDRNDYRIDVRTRRAPERSGALAHVRVASEPWTSESWDGCSSRCRLRCSSSSRCCPGARRVRCRSSWRFRSSSSVAGWVWRPSAPSVAH